MTKLVMENVYVHINMSQRISQQTHHPGRLQISLTSNLKWKLLLYFHITLSNHHCMTYFSHLAAVQVDASLQIHTALN